MHNAGRSQIAAAFFNEMTDRARACGVSAGTRPAARVHPEVVTVMAEVGIDLSSVQPRRLTPDVAASAALLITMGCGDDCPVIPGIRRDDWPLDDPQGQPLDRVRQIREEIRERVARLVSDEGWRSRSQEVDIGDDVRAAIRRKYGEAATRSSLGGGASCCSDTTDPITSGLYDETQKRAVPDAALRASLGCGNPTALAELCPGETVLDLGSGGGIDVILSAQRVGPQGKAYGLDMTDEMLRLARRNQAAAGVTNVEFLEGEIEQIPLPDGAVDVVISNCVINLSADKARVLAEAFRVLRPGGRFAVSDIVVRGEIPAQVRRNVELWVGCVAGALDEAEYRETLHRAGFTDVSIEPTRIYDLNEAREFLTSAGIDVDQVAPHVSGKVMSAFVRAIKPGGRT
jgi:ubiquinone/menaquinone biosynthesis C-methylase UbiE/protein-tyrosine-phosphatase